MYAERRHSERLMRYFGVTPVPQNAFAVHVTQEKPFERKYLYEDAMVAGKLLEFVDRALRQDSALHRLYRSEQLPDSLSYRGGCGVCVLEGNKGRRLCSGHSSAMCWTPMWM